MAMLITDSIVITPQLLANISRITEFNGAWRVIRSLTPERLRSLRRVATIESVASSTRIEGSKLSNEEVRKLLANLKVQRFTTRDEQEVAGYAEVMETVFSAWEHMPITENIICQLHRDLLAHSSKDERHRGQYKTINNNMAAFDAEGRQVAVVFETASPFDTPRLMAELVEWTQKALQQKETAGLHPLLIIAIFVVVFLEIHPFKDGNGRLSRVLTTLLMLKAGYGYVPYSSLESIIEQNKSAYYLALRQTQGTIRTSAPDWQPWLNFFLASLASQVTRLEAKLNEEKARIAVLNSLSDEILALAEEKGRVTVALVEANTEAKRATIKAHIVRLVAMGKLSQRGVGRGTWYQIMNDLMNA